MCFFFGLLLFLLRVVHDRYQCHRRHPHKLDACFGSGGVLRKKYEELTNRKIFLKLPVLLKKNHSKTNPPSHFPKTFPPKNLQHLGIILLDRLTSCYGTAFEVQSSKDFPGRFEVGSSEPLDTAAAAATRTTRKMKLIFIYYANLSADCLSAR